MTNGFEIKISEADFKSKPANEQNWILFQGITGVQRYVEALDKNGCGWGQQRYRATGLKRISAIAGGITFALGIIYIIYQMASH